MGFSVPAALLFLSYLESGRVPTEEFPSDTPRRRADFDYIAEHFLSVSTQQVTSSSAKLKMRHILCLDKTPNKNTLRVV